VATFLFLAIMDVTELLLTVKSKSRKAAEESLTGHIRSVTIDDFYSAALKRRVKMEVLLPPWYEETPDHSFPVLYINDGQSLKAIKMREALMQCYENNIIPPVIVVGIIAQNRMQEYGVAASPDYKNRGGKANKYSRFITNELIPLINKNFRTKPSSDNTAIAGFSLGGLSAFDIVWNNHGIFGSAGIFSGSFWWRSKDYKDGYDEQQHRIAHNMIKNSRKRDGLRLWFQCGTEDETADRNKNGYIDSIDDTLDIIKELHALGYDDKREIKYVEVAGGYHHESTWADVMPMFLEFAFGGKVRSS
jgi:enterochelin esterase-like enzyme